MIKKSFNNQEKNYLFKELFFRNLFECNHPITKNSKNSTFYVADNINRKIEYKLNNHGYRGEDFNEPAEILTLGCSQTHGHGLPQNYIWPEVFSNMTNKKVHNLGTNGDSLCGQVFKAFKYFQEIGNPKVIIGLFPSSRIEMPYISGIFGNNSKVSDSVRHLRFIQKIFLKNAKERVKYSKIPHNPEDFIPEEFGLFYSFMFMQMLEQYCKQKNIMLLWTFWDDEWFIDNITKIVPEPFTNYVLKDQLFYDVKDRCNNGIVNSKKENLTCHQQNKEIYEHYLYDHASDCDHKKESLGHFGIHTNLHVADMFYKEYLKKNRTLEGW
jgi:hypothetical protein